MSKKILLIVEGESDEVRFFRRLFKCCYQKFEYNFYSYKTNLHVLAQELYNNYPDFESDNIDIKLVLSSLEDDEDKKWALKEQYTDVFLVFDFEPHDHHTHFDTVKRMLNYFTDSTGQGKLFINYPMMQSYKHFLSLPDSSFVDRCVTMEEVKRYKSLVAEESCFTDLAKYDYKTFFSIAYHHLWKANYVQTGVAQYPSLKSFQKLDCRTIFDNQVVLATSEEKKVFVLNTCIFSMVEFAPKKYFDYVKKHKTELLI